MEVRDSFDFALSELQLIELAVQSGYLRLEDVRVEAHELVENLLWSAAARAYVINYDYVSVQWLVSRLDLDWFSTAKPPEPRQDGPVRFATFLDFQRGWVSDPELETWLSFLDDYVLSSHEQEQFWYYLETSRVPGNSKALERFEKLVSGAIKSLLRLSDLFGLFEDDDELVPYAIFYSYWLAKLFGYKLQATGYVRDTNDWQKGSSWVAGLTAHAQRLPELAAPSDEANEEDMFANSTGIVAVVREVARGWELARAAFRRLT